ncbi:MAG: histidine phosphatase family protein [Cytophagales bacterium]
MAQYSKTIYLIRHGQTEYNLKGIVQGSGIDSDLNENGQIQAKKFFEAYKHIPFDKIYTSKLKRTVQSVQSFIDLGTQHEAFSGFNEISWGDQDGIASNAEMHNYFVEVSTAWANGNLDLQIGGGESPNQVAERQQPVMEEILTRHEEKTIIICMHGRAMRILLCHIMGKSLTEMDTFEHSNLCLYILGLKDGKLELVEANCVSHLS